MKKLLYIAAIFISLTSCAQTQIVTGSDSYYVFLSYTSPRVHQADSVQIWSTILTNGSVSGISWSQVSGPTVPINPTFSTKVGILGQSSFWLQGVTPGTYVFTATATVNGKPFSTNDTLNVIANVICPAPRTVTAISLTMYGQPVNVTPGSGTKVTMSDGTTQSF